MMNLMNNNMNQMNSQNYHNKMIDLINNSMNQMNQLKYAINQNNMNNKNNKVFPNSKYYFPLCGLNNIGLTCYMNATLQCLLHVSELSDYFINQYKIDSDYLLNINKDAETNGKISREFSKIIVDANSEKKEIKKIIFIFFHRKGNKLKILKRIKSSLTFSTKHFCLQNSIK